jgi:hypothetical protein
VLFWILDGIILNAIFMGKGGAIIEKKSFSLDGG